MLWLCEKCRKSSNSNNIHENGYVPILSDNYKRKPCHVCGDTNEKIIDMSIEDFSTILHIQNDVNFLEAMIDLKEKDIVEYQLKMSQFRNQTNQQRVVRESSVPKCPHCHSTQIKSISGLERGASVLAWGLFSKKINKSFKCNNCGYTW